jgi:hypothetical protein
MDHGSFDRLARLLGAAGTRRAALTALLSGGIAGASTAATAGSKRQKPGKHHSRTVAAQAADCSSLGHGANVSNCEYSGEDHSGEDLSSSIMVGTNFNNADLIDTDLSSSNMRGARFRGADLCGADLSSSTLRNADMRGFAFPGRQTNLTRADLHSSGCTGLQTNSRTVFCRTILCDGSISDANCPIGVDPNDVCCTDDDCTLSSVCDGGICECDIVDTCFDQESCGSSTCFSRLPVDGGQCVCADSFGQGCSALQDCASNADCASNEVCTQSCCSTAKCFARGCAPAPAARRGAAPRRGRGPDPS